METMTIAMPSFLTLTARPKNVAVQTQLLHVVAERSAAYAVRGITGVLSVKAGVGDAVATPAARGNEPPPRRDPR